MTMLIAACGLDCAKCDAYIATQANDQVALEKVAERWRVDYKSPNITAANILCDGCMTGGRTVGYCKSVKFALVRRNMDWRTARPVPTTPAKP